MSGEGKEEIEAEARAWKEACEQVPRDFCIPHGWHTSDRCTICLDKIYQRLFKQYVEESK
jgi:hypothetical protein